LQQRPAASLATAASSRPSSSIAGAGSRAAQISLIGLAEANAEPAAALRDALADAMEGLPAPLRHDDNAVRDLARRVLPRGLNERFGKRH